MDIVPGPGAPGERGWKALDLSAESIQQTLPSEVATSSREPSGDCSTVQHPSGTEAVARLITWPAQSKTDIATGDVVGTEKKLVSVAITGGALLGAGLAEAPIGAVAVGVAAEILTVGVPALQPVAVTSTAAESRTRAAAARTTSV